MVINKGYHESVARCRRAGFRNDLHTTIICISGGNSVHFTTKRSESIQMNPTVVDSPANDGEDNFDYIGNRNSKNVPSTELCQSPSRKIEYSLTPDRPPLMLGFHLVEIETGKPFVDIVRMMV